MCVYGDKHERLWERLHDPPIPLRFLIVNIKVFRVKNVCLWGLKCE